MAQECVLYSRNGETDQGSSSCTLRSSRSLAFRVTDSLDDGRERKQRDGAIVRLQRTAQGMGKGVQRRNS
jgi:hypothetical protein